MRANAAPPGGSWDRTVATLKVALPAAALAVLAACLVWPLTSQQDFSFILSKDRVAEAQERLRMDRAVYRGEDSKGQPFTISAASAVQKSSDTPVVELRDISAQLRTADGVARADAGIGRYDLEREQIAVVGPVTLQSTNGYRLETRDVNVDLASRRVTGSGRVEGAMPLGSFSAARMQADVDGRRVILDGGASLRIVQR
jgi:lipopolysaccharide export system protein LptC